jgi:hypothetical protein
MKIDIENNTETTSKIKRRRGHRKYRGVPWDAVEYRGILQGNSVGGPRCTAELAGRPADGTLHRALRHGLELHRWGHGGDKAATWWNMEGHEGSMKGTSTEHGGHEGNMKET